MSQITKIELTRVEFVGTCDQCPTTFKSTSEEAVSNHLKVHRGSFHCGKEVGSIFLGDQEYVLVLLDTETDWADYCTANGVYVGASHRAWKGPGLYARYQDTGYSRTRLESAQEVYNDAAKSIHEQIVNRRQLGKFLRENRR